MLSFFNIIFNSFCSSYQSSSLAGENKLSSPELLNGFCSDDKKAPGVSDTDNSIEPPDRDEEVNKMYKKLRTRLWFFNAVSKSNCCDCYKGGGKLSGSETFMKVNTTLVLLNFFSKYI